MKEYTHDEILLKATSYCSKAEKCESEVRQKLFQWGYSQHDIQNKIIDYLYNEHYLDDERYCNAFVNDKFKFQHWGKVKIRTMLLSKGLPKVDVESAINTISEDDYMRVLSETAQQKIRYAKLDIANQADCQKLINFLFQRGFEYNVISKVLAL